MRSFPPQANTFIIEETCTETTVENFIPHTGQPNYVDVDYNNIENQVFISQNHFSQDSSKSANMIQLALQNNGQGLTADKIKHILGNEVPSNVEIMFKTSDGSFVTVTDEVLQNLSTKDGLQYQVVDENGHVGEIQELQVLGRENVEKIDKIESQDMPKDLSSHNSHLSSVSNPEDYISTHFLDASQIVFSTENSVRANMAGPSDISMENSKSFNHDPSFESQSTINENGKDIELLSLNSEDLKPAFMENNQCDDNIDKVNNYYDFEESAHDLKPNKSVDENELDDISISVEDKYKITELSSLSPKKTRSLKFSPDMFFADISTNNPADSMDEPEQKNFA
ncbi:hypothetical protein NQ314_002194 [Rhamnusium bicolor]|uniref:Uncharacterized protein n=1 Tax=Rhamnusium bicolor TaxID=1586634 RepID=A0AAV8ZS98_9CUCU|nr:hypothetical protein NQ314_002194 [Rhamnusium bicolor]